ncbi:DUF4193 domain-containing protein [Rhodococcus sp. HNM0569]|uniref:DUF4193 domain-containing protein n=1 Tax=Rhodococcus sp. HNM0569 TaxID=2716340 RepID=UPI00146DEC91|nr:DUF4193 domain-containing protein [Rhodococcus sp. HNM0569]NLU84536.1 DUF4193 domain-containing protein [Rhodococcus sp. HNM0569]
MPTDYDAPRVTVDDEIATDSLEALQVKRTNSQTSAADVEESDTAESFELPGADLSGEELTVKVVPKQRDEFTCTRCFLVHHRSNLASDANGEMICEDCAG